MSTISVEIIRPREEEPSDRRWQDPDQLICPVCVEPVRPEPPAYWVVADGLPVPQFSHEDGSALCKTTGDDGTRHAEPIPAKW